MPPYGGIFLPCVFRARRCCGASPSILLKGVPFLVHSSPWHQPLVLTVRFFRTEAGNEPVREWLAQLPRTHRQSIGIEIKSVQTGWPLGMPLVRKMERGLWEVRVDLGDTCARVLFTLVEGVMILLHGFIKKSQKTPQSDLETARQRMAKLWSH
jgi:phage-related protein